MKKLLAIMFALVLTSSFAFADYTDDAYFHAHLYCQYSVVAGPDVFLGDFMIGGAGDPVANTTPIEFIVYGQANTGDFTNMLDSYYQGFENWQGWSEHSSAGHTAITGIDYVSPAEHFDVDAATPDANLDGTYGLDEQMVFGYEEATYTVSFTGEDTQASLNGGTGNVTITLMATLNDGAISLTDGDGVQTWEDDITLRPDEQGVVCNGTASFEVWATDLSSDDTVAPGPYTFQQTLTVVAVNY